MTNKTIDNKFAELEKRLCRLQECCEGGGLIGITILSPPVTPPGSGDPLILVNQTTLEIFIWDGDSWELFTSGGGGGDPFYFSVTRAAADVLVAADLLIPGALYKINDRGDRGIFIEAISVNQFEEEGTRLMLVPTTYEPGGVNDGNDWQSIWRLGGESYSAGQLVIWDAHVYQVIGGNSNGSDPANNPAEYTLITKTAFTNNEYVEKEFSIIYNWDSDWISEQWDHQGNHVKIDETYSILSLPVPTVTYGIAGIDNEWINQTDWNYVGFDNNAGNYVFSNNIVTGWIKNNFKASGNIMSIYDNNVLYGIYNNSNTGVIYNNTNKGNIFNNSNIIDISNNSNVGNISNNDGTGYITNNINNGNINNNSSPDIYYNNNTGNIDNNSCGSIYFNSCMGHIRDNSNGGAIYENVNTSNIESNSHIGDIYQNTNSERIIENSGNITTINNNSNLGGVGYNSNNGKIDFNSNLGFIETNSNDGDISHNNNVGNISSNTNTGSISTNSNLGTISVNSIAGGISLNSNLGAIQFNTNGSGIINNNNRGAVSFNDNSGSIANNSNSAEIAFNGVNLMAIINNANNGAIDSNNHDGNVNNNTNNGYISNCVGAGGFSVLYNINNGFIDNPAGLAAADVTDVIVNK